MLDELQACLMEHFDVEHSTFRFERQVHTDHEHATHASVSRCLTRIKLTAHQDGD
jgi:hypothetical protein